MPVEKLSPGVPVKFMDAVTTAAPVNSSGYALPHKSYSDVRPIVWKTSFAGGPSAVNVILQGALNDVDAEYVQLDASTVTAGEQRTVSAVLTRFVRARLATRTGGTSATVEVMI